VWGGGGGGGGLFKMFFFLLPFACELFLLLLSACRDLHMQHYKVILIQVNLKNIFLYLLIERTR